jgi:hypothetical protein
VFVVLTLWTAGTLGSAMFKHAEAVDVACGEISLDSPTGSRVAAPTAVTSTDGHCDLCHLQRIVRSAIAASSSLGCVVESASCVPSAEHRVGSAVAPIHLPARAPPTSL